MDNTQGTWYGKTYQAHLVQTKEETSKASLQRLQESQRITHHLCLCLKKEFGQSQDVYTMTWGTGQLLGDYTMHSFGESPNAVKESRLSQILEDSPLPKYYLSPKACRGILKRANKRGKKLPVLFEAALIAQSHIESEHKDRAEIFPTVNSQYVFDARGNGNGKTVCTITGDHQNRVTDYTALCVGNGQLNQISMAEQSNTLDTMHDQQAVIHGGMVRRLTPLECERLQGFPDGWTDVGEWVDSNGRKRRSSDAARYKSLGNSIAIPFWEWLLGRISEQFVTRATLGSLFDGIGGFPLCWEIHNGVGSAIWASEIEEFPIAVTKYHFPDTEEKY